ncbi:unnamed protein product [Protopolystoma xenopodis]|uniref:Uncharacterized protein n=1 Tax=Protopolystoma xenopodis TaxID=117903 RepID=A0A448WFZ3_9PLAT|nr:unnamed protein product [Protopolystoma xenopodis]
MPRLNGTSLPSVYCWLEISTKEAEFRVSFTLKEELAGIYKCTSSSSPDSAFYQPVGWDIVKNNLAYDKLFSTYEKGSTRSICTSCMNKSWISQSCTENLCAASLQVTPHCRSINLQDLNKCLEHERKVNVVNCCYANGVPLGSCMNRCEMVPSYQNDCSAFESTIFKCMALAAPLELSTNKFDIIDVQPNDGVIFAWIPETSVRAYITEFSSLHKMSKLTVYEKEQTYAIFQKRDKDILSYSIATTNTFGTSEWTHPITVEYKKSKPNFGFHHK